MKNTTHLKSKAVAQNECCFCDTPDFNFDGILSMDEYKISGMCQTCQDSFFNLDGESENDFFEKNN